MSKALVRADVRNALAGSPASVTVTCADESTPGVFDNADDQQFLSPEGSVKVNGRILRVTTGDLSTLERGATLTIDDGETTTDYLVREVSRDNDGLETVVQLVEA